MELPKVPPVQVQPIKLTYFSIARTRKVAQEKFGKYRSAFPHAAPVHRLLNSTLKYLYSSYVASHDISVVENKFQSTCRQPVHSETLPLYSSKVWVKGKGNYIWIGINVKDKVGTRRLDSW